MMEEIGFVRYTLAEKVLSDLDWRVTARVALYDASQSRHLHPCPL
jgi:hypothetical protein